MKDKEKAYRDKLIGAKFIEFLRKRLILLREILADDGSIYVHLVWKKGHYIKAIMDEVFGEHNFQNEIIWCYSGGGISLNYFPKKHDNIYVYKKNPDCIFNPVYRDYTEGTKERGRTKVKGENAELRESGTPIEDWWSDVPKVTSPTDPQKVITNGYPTQKSEELLKRIIKVASNKGDIVLDAFAGSGTTLSVAEKLNRKWMGMDSGKLAIYTIQKRMLNLTSQIGSNKRDNRREYERVNDIKGHSKSYSRGLFMIYEKARKGELSINDDFLRELAIFLEKNMKLDTQQEFSLFCPESKFKIKKLKVIENNGEYRAGTKVIKIGKINFLISFIQEKKRSKTFEPLESKEFVLYNAGVYDFEKVKELGWEHYRDFVLNLFNVREEKEKVYGLEIDGYIGTYPVYIWNYPEKKNQRLDKEYIESIDESMERKAGDKFYIIAPITSLDFMQDEVKVGNTTYIILKVPESILLKLMEQGKEGALEQPISENDVNEVIDAVGYDFISQPVIDIDLSKGNPKDITLFNKDNDEYLIKINEFKSNTLASDPSDFENFETLSMVMIDTDFNGDYFELDKVYWADELVNNELSRLKKNKNDGFEEKIDSCQFLIVRIKEEDFKGNKMMAIFMDKYGNEKKLVLNKEDFNEC
jgi:DNA modification methylase